MSPDASAANSMGTALPTVAVTSSRVRVLGSPVPTASCVMMSAQSSGLSTETDTGDSLA